MTRPLIDVQLNSPAQTSGKVAKHASSHEGKSSHESGKVAHSPSEPLASMTQA